MLPRSTRTLWTDPAEPDPSAIDEAAEILRRGGLVAFATETVYGLGADATDPEAVARIFEAKGRPSFNPLIVHVRDAEMARRCVADWPEAAETLERKFWPGPLTPLVLPALGPDPLRLVTAGLATVGVRDPRVSSRPASLIAAAGFPLAAPSANRSNGVSPTLAKHVLADLDGRVDLILDSGQTTEGIESTVLELTTREPHVLRPGPDLRGGRSISHSAVSAASACAASWPSPPGICRPNRQHRAPDSSPLHYGPEDPGRPGRLGRTARRLPPGPPDPLLIVIVGDHPAPELCPRVRSPPIALPTPDQAAIDLYVVLRDCDNLGADLIVVLPPPHEPAWEAVRDRLHRAAQAWSGTGVTISSSFEFCSLRRDGSRRKP